jgi:hypothetical protein
MTKSIENVNKLIERAVALAYYIYIRSGDRWMSRRGNSLVAHHKNRTYFYFPIRESRDWWNLIYFYCHISFVVKRSQRENTRVLFLFDSTSFYWVGSDPKSILGVSILLSISTQHSIPIRMLLCLLQFVSNSFNLGFRMNGDEVNLTEVNKRGI